MSFAWFSACVSIYRIRSMFQLHSWLSGNALVVNPNFHNLWDFLVFEFMVCSIKMFAKSESRLDLFFSCEFNAVGKYWDKPPYIRDSHMVFFLPIPVPPHHLVMSFSKISIINIWKVLPLRIRLTQGIVHNFKITIFYPGQNWDEYYKLKKRFMNSYIHNKLLYTPNLKNLN